MSVAKCVVLGMLGERPGYPYELARRLERRIGPAWQLNDGHLYLAVADLERQGFIERCPDLPRGEGAQGRRRVMRLTDRGQEELERWFAGPVRDDLGRLRSELTAKLLLADLPHAEMVLGNLVDHERARSVEARALMVSRAPLSRTTDWEAALVELLREAALSMRVADLHWVRAARGMLLRRTRQAEAAPSTAHEDHSAQLTQVLTALRSQNDEFLGSA